jgi:hypothetical protein
MGLIILQAGAEMAVLDTQLSAENASVANLSVGFNPALFSLACKVVSITTLCMRQFNRHALS